MPAWSEMTEAAIWVQTTQPAQVQIRYTPVRKRDYSADSGYIDIADVPAKNGPLVNATAESDLIAVSVLTDLDWGTDYRYELLIDGEVVQRDYPLTFKTQPHWRWAVRPPQPPDLKIMLGSCSYINEAKTDRPGNPYGQDPAIYQTMANQRADFMLWLGDNVYYREMEWLTEQGMRRRWRYDRSMPFVQQLLASTVHYATWDDHDFGPNNSDRSFRLKGEALDVFSDYFPTVRRGTPETQGAFHRFEWGDVEVFMLDDRYHRAPNNAPNSPEKSMLGDAQMQWLKDSLSNSIATFKIIANGNQVTKPQVYGEGMVRFGDDLPELMDYIREAKIPGVLFLSGDIHSTELLRTPVEGSYPMYEFTCSSITAGSASSQVDTPVRVPGTKVTGTNNFGTIEVLGPSGSRKLVLQSLDKSGKALWTHEISQSELTPPSQ